MKVHYWSIQLFICLVLMSASLPTWAANWYVRPAGETTGAKDGTSYADAWEKLASVQWGPGGVQAGDTLFVCGTHYEWGGLKVGASGTSDNNRIVINGDCPNDVGTIWATEYLPPAVWTSNGDGTYWAPLNKSGVRTGASGEPGLETLLIPVDDQATVITTDGSIWFDTSTRRLYYNPIGAVKKVMAYWGNSAIFLKGNDYVTITGSSTHRFKIRGGRCCNRGTISVANGDQGDTAAEHVTIQYADIAFGGYTGVRNSVGSHHLHVLDNVFHDLPTGVYVVLNVNDDPQSDHLVIKRNEIYSGVRNVAHNILTFDYSDHHAFGSMGGDDMEISENYIHDWRGMGINLYMGSNDQFTMKRFKITHNRFENLIGEGTEYPTGISIGGTSSSNFSSRMAGSIISYNTIKNCPKGLGDWGHGAGIRIKSGTQGPLLKVHNNTISDCYYGLYSRNVSPEGTVGFEFINNIITNPKPGGYFVFVEQHPIERIVDMRHNLYYPLSAGRFFYGHEDVSFSDWKEIAAISNPDQVGTLTIDPLLNPNFTLASTSPAIGAGSALETQFEGCLDPTTAWPSNVKKINQLLWDIGAYCGQADPPPPASTLLEEDFSTGSLSGWSVVDEGTRAAPSAWSATTGSLVQSSNIHGGSGSRNGLPKPGTFLYYANGLGWTDYQATFTLRSTDNDALGAMFRYQDPNNYYRFSWDRERGYRRLVKVENGTTTLLAEDSVPYVTGQTYQVDIRAEGNQIEVRIGNSLILTAIDSSFSSGSFAFYSWGNLSSVFDDLLVQTLGGSPPPFLQEDFSTGSLSGWSVVDEGTISAPSAWSATTGSLVQSSNIHGGSGSRNGLPKPGTFLYYANGLGWTDYQATFTLRSTDNDALGAMFRYQDPNNYYRFSWDRERGYRRLVKVENGTTTLLAEDSVPYVTGQTYQVDIRAEGNQIEVRIGNSLILTAIDSSFSSGSFAFYSWGNLSSVFDDLLVQQVGN